MNDNVLISERVTVRIEAFSAPLQTWFEVTAYPTEEGLAVYFQDMAGAALAAGIEPAYRKLHLQQSNSGDSYGYLPPPERPTPAPPGLKGRRGKP